MRVADYVGEHAADCVALVRRVSEEVYRRPIPDPRETPDEWAEVARSAERPGDIVLLVLPEQHLGIIDESGRYVLHVLAHHRRGTAVRTSIRHLRPRIAGVWRHVGDAE